MLPRTMLQPNSRIKNVVPSVDTSVDPRYVPSYVPSVNPYKAPSEQQTGYLQE